MLVKRPSRVALTELHIGYFSRIEGSSFCGCSLQEQCFVLQSPSKQKSPAYKTFQKQGLDIEVLGKPECVQVYTLHCLVKQKYASGYYKLLAHREYGTRSEFALAVGLGLGNAAHEPSEHALKSLEAPCETPLALEDVLSPSAHSTESPGRGATSRTVQSQLECSINGSTSYVCPWTSAVNEQKDYHETEWKWSQFLDYPSQLQSCGTNKTLCLGKLVHHDLCCNSMENDTYNGVVLVEMYLKCESIKDAHMIFFSLHVHGTFSWNLMIRSYTSEGQDAEALQCLNHILVEASLADKYTYVSLLSSCVNLTDLGATQRIHACIVSGRHQFDVVVRNALINAYTKCGSISEAQIIFDMMSERDSFSWDTLIGAYAQHKLHHEALCLFYQQQHHGVLPTRITYVAILDSCGSQGLTGETTHIFARICGSEFKANPIIQATVLHLFGKVGNGKDAWRMFCKMSDRSSSSWNAILASCLDSSHGKGTLELYSRMLGEVVLPCEETFIRIISLCGDAKMLALGKCMHACSISSPKNFKVVVGNALIRMYSRCTGLKDACKVFDWMPERSIVTWTTMVGAYVEHGQAMLAIALFDQMLGEGLLSDKIMLISILDACASLRSPIRLKRLHARIVGMGLDLDPEVGSCLASLYGKCGALKAAERMLDAISDRDTLLWSAMVCAYAEHDRANVAIQFFQQMEQEGILPNEVTFFGVLDACAKLSAIVEGRRFHARLSSSGFGGVSINTALIRMYGRCGSLEESQRVFNDATEQDIVLLTAMMANYTQSGKVKQALHLFDKALQKGVKPDEVAYLNALSMCSHAGLVDEGHRYFSSMSRDHDIKPTIHHYNCMIDLYGRAGCVCEAEEMITSMPFTATALQWMTLLSACRRQLDVLRGERAARQVMLLEPKDPLPYIELSNIYSALSREAEAVALLNKVKDLE